LFSQHGKRRLFDTLLLLQQPARPLDQCLWTLERDEGEMDVSFMILPTEVVVLTIQGPYCLRSHA
jgi:hypothetical protein